MIVRCLRWIFWVLLVSCSILLTWAILAVAPGVDAPFSEVGGVTFLIAMTTSAFAVTWFFLDECCEPGDEDGTSSRSHWSIVVLGHTLGDLCIFAGLTLPFATFVAVDVGTLGRDLLAWVACLIGGGCVLKVAVGMLGSVPDRAIRDIRAFRNWLPVVNIASLMALGFA